MDLARLERIYDAYAKIYDRLFGRVFDAPRKRAVEWLAATPGERVLEVGVGTGIALPMYGSGPWVIGVDFSFGMLLQAQRCIAVNRIGNAHILRMDAMRMAFADSSFDALMAAYVVTAVPDHKRLLGEMVRVCRPGGRIVIVNHLHHRNRWIAFGQRMLSPLTQRLGWRTDLSLDDVLADTPIEVVRVTTVPPFGLWYLVEGRNTKSG
ncbi:MAG: methyltransferase domain-containing protein [Proteobacteria bacterium]|nr:methyltransferase domain-containing protein [Burkholderiales bacterium]